MEHSLENKHPHTFVTLVLIFSLLVKLIFLLKYYFLFEIALHSTCSTGTSIHTAYNSILMIVQTTGAERRLTLP